MQGTYADAEAPVTSRWNSEIVKALVNGAKETMIQKHNVQEQNIHIESVPGSWELPIGVSRLHRFRVCLTLD